MGRYFIYKTAGGLNYMLGQINNAIYLSKTTNRFLIIDCNGDAFCNDFNKYFNIPDFVYTTNYDCLYQDNSLDKNTFESYINGKFRISKNCEYLLNDKIIPIKLYDIISYNEQIIYFNYLSHPIPNISWYIKVNKDIVDKLIINKINEKYIGVHYRNTDIKNEINTYISEIQKISDCNLVYLATDDYTAFEKFNELLKNKFKIIQYTKPLDMLHGECNIHYGNPNKDEVIMNTLIDMYHLINSTYFIPSGNSALSKRVLQFKIKDEFFI